MSLVHISLAEKKRGERNREKRKLGMIKRERRIEKKGKRERDRGGGEGEEKQGPLGGSERATAFFSISLAPLLLSLWKSMHARKRRRKSEAKIDLRVGQKSRDR